MRISHHPEGFRSTLEDGPQPEDLGAHALPESRMPRPAMRTRAAEKSHAQKFSGMTLTVDE